LMEKITAIPHIRWIRLHTRIPIVATHRITEEMLDALKSTKAVTMAVHTNHAREITPKVQDVLAKLAANGVILLGQSVLLKGVNDNKEALIDLLETLMANRVKPYYLHHPGLTAGTSHFRIPLTKGMALMNQVQQHVSGVCLPQYTLDIPGGVTKIAINPYTCQPVEGKPGHYTLHDPMGGIHNYSDVIPKA
jgi:lysine 2,3-aminomutase